ncbi:Stage II sporulation protein E (SpoIIE) [Quadrisphaera sp. DSM 44207]|nr:Stage II sporulation protein E (SpoIIE) [Quadrisphaera sp. DSM 44207]
MLDVRPPPRLRAAVAVTALVGSFLVAAMPAVGFGDEQAMGWLGVFPLVASLVLGWRLTALAGACAVLAAGVLMVTDPGATPTGSVLRWAVVVALAAFAVLNCLVRERREARLRQVAEVARVAQSAILQPVPSRAGSWSFAARYRSAHRAAAVGGDLLEVVEVGDGRVRAVLGDVRGKGLPAVRLAATALAAFREASLRRDLPLPEVVRLVDRSVSAAAGDEDFVTAAFLELDPGGWVQVVNCGHPPPLRSSARGGQVSALTPTSCSTPLGLNPVCRPDTFTLEQGTACCSSPTACWRRGTPAARCCPRGS